MAKTRAAPKGPVPITVEGRTFVLEENPSFEQDMFIMDLTDKMGLNTGHIEQLSDSNLEAITEQIVLNAYRSGHMFDLLGALMVEKDSEEPWSPDIAAETAETFKKLRDREMVRKLEMNMVFMLLAFFANGLSSSKTSLSYSGSEDGESPKSEAEEPTTSEIGSPSSASLQGVIQAANKRSRGGRSGKGSSPS